MTPGTQTKLRWRGLAAVTLSAAIFVEGCATSARPPSPAAGDPARAATTRRAEPAASRKSEDLPAWFWVAVGVTVAVGAVVGGAFALSQALK